MSRVDLKIYDEIFKEIIKKHKDGTSADFLDSMTENIDEILNKLSKKECMALFFCSCCAV